MRSIGGTQGIGAPLSPGRTGGDTWIRRIGDRLVLDMHEGAGTIVRDLSGNGNDGVFGAGAATPTWGKNRLFFDGNDYVDCGRSGSLSLRSNYTFILVAEPWNPATLAIISNADEDWLNSQYDIYCNVYGFFENAWVNDDNWEWYGSNLLFADFQQETHLLTVVKSGPDTVQHFLDITEYETIKYDEVDPPSIRGNTRFGTMGEFEAWFWTGYIDFIRVNASALSEPQVLQDYLWNKWRN